MRPFGNGALRPYLSAHRMARVLAWCAAAGLVSLAGACGHANVEPRAGATLPVGPHAEAAAALGLPPLASARLASDERELRLWISPPYGSHLELYRLHARGADVRGVAAGSWSTDLGADATGEDTAAMAEFARHMRGQFGCERVEARQARAVCASALSPRAPEWAALLRALDSLGVDTLPGSSASGLDGFRLTVETRRGAAYRVYSYWSPSRESLVDDERRAADVMGRLRQARERIAAAGAAGRR